MVENTEGSERTMAEVEAIKTNEDISRMENSIKKEISKLKYYLEPENWKKTKMMTKRKWKEDPR